jgi:CUG-BP- and ETR3-like factor
MNTPGSLPTLSSSPSSAAVSTTNIEKHEPDSDTIKMFCGQIPRNMHESELREMFEQFGPVFQLNVLRDKQTGESKGCCFVTYYSRKSALEAQNALHNLRTLNGSHHPIQMKPADTENRNERKLFVGMVSKNFDEQSIRVLFQSYGTIEDCTILRDANGKSRGCAFVTFQKRQCALNAIKSMHQSQTMEGCSSPLVVKFADTPKDKETKKIQQQFTTHHNGLMQQMPPGNSMPNHQHMNTYNFLPEISNLVFLQQLLKNYGFYGNNGTAINFGALNNLLQMFSNNMSLNGNKPPLLPPPPPPGTTSNMTLNSQHGSNQSLNVQEQQHTLSSPRPPPPNLTNNTYNTESSLLMCGTNAYNSGGPSPNNGNVPPNNHHNQNGGLTPSVAAPGTGPYPPTIPSLYANSGSPLSNGCADAHHNLQNLVAMSQVNNGGLLPTNIHQNPTTNSSVAPGASFPVFSSPSYLTSQVAGKHTEGPDGANLFIYHLPQEYSDNDLAQAFAPYGPIISAKVFVDKTTNRSKCFGFVSYDNPSSAQAAINQMNGFQIGMKRLKVQLKKLRNDGNPNPNNNNNSSSPNPIQTTASNSPNNLNGSSPTTSKKSSY